MKITNVAIPAAYADAIDEIVRNGEYASRNEFVREAVRDKLTTRGMLKNMASLETPEEVVTYG